MREQRNWFKLVIDLSNSVISAIWLRVVISMVFSLAIVIAYYRGFNVNQPVLASLIPGVVLGLLLVFRTNTAYERFWEGRKLWGQLIITGRVLSKNIFVIAPALTPEEEKTKIENIRLIGVLVVAIKLHLRSEPIDDRMRSMLSKKQYLELKTVINVPLRIIQWISAYCHNLYRLGAINYRLFIELNQSLDRIIDILGGLERILKTPMPQAYSIHLKHLLLIYCLALPFQLVAELGGLTVIAVGVISFSLLGIEEIGLEIENPFGYDPNDLPLDDFCNTLHYNIEELLDSE